ncbi:acid protease [Suillus decipiens]|nr:acid protease [Suillus decipiens]
MPTVAIPTVTNRLAGSGTIVANILGVFFKPYGGSEEATAGQLTFGGTDPALHTTGITYAFVTNRAPASNYWGIDQSITYGGAPILANAVGIVDSGHNLIALATEAFQLYQAATGAQRDPMTGLLVITVNQYIVMQNLNFHIDGVTFALTPNAQIWPRVLNYRIGGQYGSMYLVVRDIGTQVGQGDYDIINGYVFMQRFYTVFDTANSRVGFAQTQFTAANTN